MPTFRIMSSVLDDHGEIVPDLGPTIKKMNPNYDQHLKYFLNFLNLNFYFGKQQYKFHLN